MSDLERGHYSFVIVGFLVSLLLEAILCKVPCLFALVAIFLCLLYFSLLTEARASFFDCCPFLTFPLKTTFPPSPSSDFFIISIWRS